MYKRIGPAAVEHDSGYVVGSNDRYSVKYTDSSQVVTVSVERGITVDVFPITMRSWTKNFHPSPLSETDRRAIMDRIIGAWGTYTSQPLVINYSHEEPPAEPPRSLYWVLFDGTRRPITLPDR